MRVIPAQASWPGDGKCCHGWVSTDQVGTTGKLIDPKLGPLQDNGGPWNGFTFPASVAPPRRRILTHEVLAWSPALRNGNPLVDARGVRRDEKRPNVGAYEATLDGLRGESESPRGAYAGFPFDLRVTATDPLRKAVYVYEGAIRFTSSDPTAVLPPDGTYSLTDEGTRVFSDVMPITFSVSRPITTPHSRSD